MKKVDIHRPQYKLFIKVLDKSKPAYVDDYGHLVKFVKWVEVKEINFGSAKNPNKDILGFKLEPIKYEDDDQKAMNDALKDLLKRLGLQ